MSFSSQIKEKLCKSEYGCMNCAAYELSGALMFGGNIGSDSIKFATENENIAKRITADINTAYGIQVETQVISKVQRIIIDNIYQVENITGGISQSDDIPFSCCRRHRLLCRPCGAVSGRRTNRACQHSENRN